nr:hypothetical protein [Ferrimicrobium acidiphilum]
MNWRRAKTWWLSIGAVIIGVAVALSVLSVVLSRYSFHALPEVVSPSRVAQFSLQAAIVQEEGGYRSSGHYYNESSFAALMDARDPGYMVVAGVARKASSGDGGKTVIAVTVSADEQATLFAVRSSDGGCWFSYISHRPVSLHPPFPNVPTNPGTYFGEVGTRRGPNRSCSVTQGPMGTNGNSFVGWSLNSYPPLQGHVKVRRLTS